MLRGLEPTVTNDDVRSSSVPAVSQCSVRADSPRLWRVVCAAQLLAFFANLGYNLLPVRAGSSLTAGA